MRLAFYFIWNNYQLVGSAGKSISTFYLSEVPDYAVYRWMTSGSLSEIGNIEQSERVLSHVILFNQLYLRAFKDTLSKKIFSLDPIYT